MMRRFLMITGLIGPLLLTQSAEAKTLYELIKATVEKEVAIEEIDSEVAVFISEFYKEKWNLVEDDVHKIMKGDGESVCGNKKLDEPGKTLVDCKIMIKEVMRMAGDEEAVRTLGRELQATATSYELPLSSFPGRSQKLSADLHSVLSIWSAGTGSVKTATGAIKIATFPVDEEKYKPLLEDIGKVLEEFSPEELTAAVWRYQYGVGYFYGMRRGFQAPPRDGESGPGTERQYIFDNPRDHDEVALRSAMTVFYNTYVKDFDLARKDDPQIGTVFYAAFPADLLTETLPENVIFWIRTGYPFPNAPDFSDMGLQWETPLEPIQPSLITIDNDPILGGNYPPEPVEAAKDDEDPEAVDGHGLCSDPVAIRGYLCRPYVAVAPEERCPEPKDLPPGEISLIHCTTTGSLRFTAAGPDVCREVEWKVERPFDPNTQCKLNLRCANDCDKGESKAVANPKDSEGVVDLCVESDTEGIPATYLMYHEMVHAYQFCTMEPGDELYEDLTHEEASALCCRIEGEAYRASCNMMEQDGVFQGASSGDLPMNAETCTEALTNAGCQNVRVDGEPLKGCYISQTYPDGFVDSLLAQMANNPKDVPVSCEDATDPKLMDPRLAGIKESVEKRNDICRPGEQTSYTNRIGNNLCYIGQCVEQSTELHRMTPGRTTAGVVDEVAPWDSPVAGSPLANLLLNPPLSQGSLPSYRPELLVREAEIALCQLQGLPPLTPPVLCIASANRQLEQPSVSGLQIAYNLVQQTQEQELSTADFLRLSPALGARAGTALYADYMREANRSFAGILDMAAQMLTEIKDIEFPTEMCPIGPGLPSPPAE